VRARKDESESVIIVHVGRGLCGHDGIVHGGLLATLLDEGLGRTAIKSLPDQVGVTAYLSIDYRAPTKADQFIVIKTRLTEVKGRKAWVEGHIEDTNGNVLAQAKFVSISHLPSPNSFHHPFAIVCLFYFIFKIIYILINLINYALIDILIFTERCSSNRSMPSSSIQRLFVRRWENPSRQEAARTSSQRDERTGPRLLHRSVDRPRGQFYLR